MVELLAVIACLTILLALALPAISSSRIAAREIACSASIRQSACGVFNYAADYRDLPPLPALDSSAGADPPHGRVTCGDYWIQSVYFGHGRWWSAVLFAAYGVQEVSAVCPGAGPDIVSHPYMYGDGGTFGLCGEVVLPSTYAFSNAYLAAPRFWRDDSPQPLSDAGLQGIARTRFPSAKAMLYEIVSFHRGRAGEKTWDLRRPVAPVAFSDGHVQRVDLNDARTGVQNRFRPRARTALHNTEEGVYGRDF